MLPRSGNREDAKGRKRVLRRREIYGYPDSGVERDAMGRSVPGADGPGSGAMAASPAIPGSRHTYDHHSWSRKDGPVFH